MPGGDFTAFCEREYPLVLGALTLWCGDRQVAEEVTAEAFARSYREWERVQGLEAPGAWVRRVAVNLATSRFRRRQAEWRARRRLRAEARDRYQDPDGADVVAVREALQHLAEDHRTVLILRYYLDLPIAEVAEHTGRTVSAITSLTQRAAAALREELRLNTGAASSQEARHDR